MKLYVTESSWSGWVENYVPQVKHHEFEVKWFKKYIVSTAQYSTKEGYETRVEFAFSVRRKTKKYVVIKTNKIMSAGERGINFYSRQKKFKIEIGKPITLRTLTKDQGRIYTFELK